MNFKDVYKLPLEKYEGTDKVFHANGHMAFDFLRRYKGRRRRHSARGGRIAEENS